MIYPGQAPVGYVELANILRAMVTSGQVKPGQRLPSEGTLAQTYGVATKTGRAALKQLRNEGLAVLIRGYGVVVREQLEPEVVVAEPGSSVWARLPTPEERMDLRVPEGVPLLILTAPDGTVELLSADRYRVDIPPPE